MIWTVDAAHGSKSLPRKLVTEHGVRGHDPDWGHASVNVIWIVDNRLNKVLYYSVQLLGVS